VKLGVRPAEKLPFDRCADERPVTESMLTELTPGLNGHSGRRADALSSCRRDCLVLGHRCLPAGAGGVTAVSPLQPPAASMGLRFFARLTVLLPRR